MQNKKFTKVELKKVEKLARENSLMEVAQYFNMTETSFMTLKTKDTELKLAFDKGVMGRSKDFAKQQMAKRNALNPRRFNKITEKTLNDRVHDDITPQEALERYRKLRDERNYKRKLQEVREVDLL